MIKALSKILFPEGIKCIVCDGELAAEVSGGVCSRCKLLNLNVRFCKKCGRAMTGAADYCSECQSFIKNFDVAMAPFVFEDDVKSLVHRFKYGNHRYLAKYMAEFMAKTCTDSEITADFITFVPIHRRKLRERGYNQAELLARETGLLLDIPVVSVLDKIKDIKNTAKMRRYQRMEMIRDSVAVIPGVSFAGKAVLLVDDVFTTGATADECSGKLLATGAERVSVLTFATSKSLKN